MEQHPRISFTFPYRWLTENRDYFGKNIEMSILHDIGGEQFRSMLVPVLAYRVEIFYQSNKTKEIPLTAKQAQTLLRPMFPNGKCLSVDVKYESHPDPVMLPLMDFRIYF